MPNLPMNTLTKITLLNSLKNILVLCLLIQGLVACSSDSGNSGNGNEGPTGDFELVATVESLVLEEGNTTGLVVPLSLIRSNNHSNPVQLEVRGLSESDVELVTSQFTTQTLLPGADSSQLVLKLAIDDRPIAAQTRNFVITATDAFDRDTYALSVNVAPTSAPDVYLLVGQSNMVGFSGDGTRQAGVGGADEPDPRIKQLNVSKNDGDGIFNNTAAFTSASANVVQPDLVTAEDPLHIPLDPNNTGKDVEYIGLGLSFAKRALLDTTAEIVLVPAAWSGSSFCLNSSGPEGNWNANETTDPNLGNTWLFDRAVTRANLALEATGGILRGILWHQGESDANDRCAPSYADNMRLLVEGLRSRIQQDSRGPELRQADSSIPFVAGTMSRGVDENSNFSVFLPAKQQIDDVHRNLPSQVAHTALSNHDDLIPANGFACGNSSCIHFGPDALREMGNRYYEAMLRALEP